MKKVCVLAMVLCLGLAASVWAADIPGQKLTDAEASSVRGMGVPVSLLGAMVIVNDVSFSAAATPTSTGYTVSTPSLTFPQATGNVMVTR